MTTRRPTPTPPGHHQEPSTPPVSAPRLYTPAQAAELLAVRESWLRRKAGQRAIPCTFLGKHLRFSAANLRDIADSGNCTPPTVHSRPRRTR
ncbi:excisionase family DNA binding protein [Saccharothrix ecbatanensis]|uniref:Excisionase family DNA binding protein n=1 Tax=Saccharothrix ecbatanensis TaxID=1105145 RepID=A0A7W9M662_9PSEU|nr:helix-turn-helix domain-containing protein [Saccharothrix ecbatanensis]MBB5808900.1 excisionase family DNA binding protein [Saccharothrix ecbatanensis]